MAHSIICPNANCGYQGRPNQMLRFWRLALIVPPFAFLAMLVYLMGVFSPAFVLVPAFLFVVVRLGRVPFCPKCRMKLAVGG